MAEQALTGIRVVEFGDFVSAPYCTKMLADLGAEVIKIEQPGTGDTARRYGPFPDDVPHPEKSGLMLYLNANKLGITLDVKSATGRKLLLELVEDADVLVENQHPGLMKALDLTHERLQEINPSLVMTSITGLGQSGPYASYKAHALQNVAGAGVASRLGEPDRYPLALPLHATDYLAGVHGAAATLLALFARDVVGEGQHIDISAMESVSTFLIGNGITNVILNLRSDGHRAGHRVPVYYPWTVLPCKDGYFEIHLGIQDRHWGDFLEAVGHPEWGRDDRWKNRLEMAPYADELDEQLRPWLQSMTRAELWQYFRERRIPCHPIHTIDEVFTSDQLAARKYFVEVEHPEAGSYYYPGAPYKLSTTPWKLSWPAPRLGEHNEEIYCGRLGLSRLDLARLRAASVI